MASAVYEKSPYEETSSNEGRSVEDRGGPALEAVGTSMTTVGLQRKLKARHIQMIAIGSNIGTGLFIGSGKALHTGGPLSLVLAFLLIGISLTIMMQCLGEMSVVLPVSGSFTRYATRFIDPALGFALGWQYWLAWVSVFASEASAFVLLINYWNDDPKWTPLWISIFLVINLAIHLAPVRVFGEVEFVVSSIKVISVVAFIVVVWAIMGGAGPKGRRHGGENWRLEGLDNGIANGFKGLGAVFVTAAFATGGTEMVGIVAGEAEHPRYNLPRAIKTLMWRIFLFYIVSMTFLTFVVSYNQPGLLGTKNANSSPFVLAIKEAGIRVLPDLLNAVVIVCVCSVGSTSVYISSRVLKSMAEDDMAFGIFAATDKQGRPWVALLFTGAVATTLSYLNCSSQGTKVFNWFSAISGMAFFIAWLCIIASNWRFRAALKAQNDDTLERRIMSESAPVALDNGILPQLLACLPAGSASTRPPLALLPLLSPILRQRIQLLAAGTSDSWLTFLCRNKEAGPQLVNLVESHASAFEPHPVSGEIEVENAGEPKYARLDAETLRAKVALDELEIEILFVWCSDDTQGLGGTGGWRVSEVLPRESTESNKGEWKATIIDAEEKFRSLQFRGNAGSSNRLEALQRQESSTGTTGSDNDDDDYWQRYDATPSRTPGPMASADLNTETPSSSIQMPSNDNDDAYFNQYASIQPEMDGDDPSAGLSEKQGSTLQGDNLLKSDIKHAPFSPEAYRQPSDSLDRSRLGFESPSEPVANLERVAENDSRTEMSIKTHVSSTIKSLWRLSRTVGISRGDFSEMVLQELKLLEMYQEDEEYKRA
ncbi:MAG: hypothetical protein M1814_000510 [Vezdaea aestivalis]|nr:MAG: hypothetical protein M1814_000510 [Vezdaea aestivalis]